MINFGVGTRREFLSQSAMAAMAAMALGAPGAYAEALVHTPRQTEGPYYPDHLPLDTDNDLIIVNNALTPAAGEITHLSGCVLDSRGDPIRNALVEIWQVDHRGIYLHTADSGRRERDGNFQGFGRFLTGSKGEYYFRTIKPVPYGQSGFQRTRHIHFAVHVPGREKFTTQCYVKDDPLNARDGVLNGIRDAKARESVIVDFAPIPNSRAGELAAHFDIILGFTPEDAHGE